VYLRTCWKTGGKAALPFIRGKRGTVGPYHQKMTIKKKALNSNSLKFGLLSHMLGGREASLKETASQLGSVVKICLIITLQALPEHVENREGVARERRNRHGKKQPRGDQPGTIPGEGKKVSNSLWGNHNYNTMLEREKFIALRKGVGAERETSKEKGESVAHKARASSTHKNARDQRKRSREGRRHIIVS